MKDASKAILRELLQSESVRSLALERIGDDALRAIQNWGQAEPTSSSEAASGSPNSTRSLVSVAISFNCDLKTLEGEDRSWILAHSVLVTVYGIKRLRLSNSERGRILNDPQATKILDELLQEFITKDEDTLDSENSPFEMVADAYLREMLRGRWTANLIHMSRMRRQAATDARLELTQVNWLADSIPSLSEFERQSDLAGLLDPLGIMIGLQVVKGGGHKDRFAGREEELRALRSIVDILESQSVAEMFGRGIERSTDTLSDLFTDRLPRMMTISAPGGMGKSTLIAKFVNDHALAPDTRFPFVYLDFDRAALQPKNPDQLLVESARQVALQFPEFDGELQGLRRWVRASTARTADESGIGSDPYRKFRSIVEEILARCNVSTFLLTLDTLELIQTDPEAIDGVGSFLNQLTSESFPKLCVVAAGRSGLAELTEVCQQNFEIEERELKALSITDARSMLNSLGRMLMKDEWRDEWTRRLSGRRGDPEARREPLSIRLAVQLVRDTAPEEREQLITKLENEGERAGEEFVGVMYERRVLDHINHPAAAKLAWPGLVARVVTPRIAKEILAPICGLTPDEAMEAYDYLGRVGWIVENAGDALHHRKDLRSRTLPLMRRHDPEKFAQVAGELAAYYGRGDTADPKFHSYYRFLQVAPENVADLDLNRRALVELREFQADFATGSEKWCMLEAANAGKPLALDYMRKVPSRLLWEHVARAGTGLRYMNEQRIDQRLMYLQEIEPLPTKDDDFFWVWQNLRIKTGMWQYADPESAPESPLKCDQIVQALFLFQMTRAGELGGGLFGILHKILEDAAFQVQTRQEWQANAFLLGCARLVNPDFAVGIDQSISQNVKIGNPGAKRIPQAALRCLMLHGKRSIGVAAEAWCASERQAMKVGISYGEFAVLAAWLTNRGEQGLSNLSRRLLDETRLGSDLPDYDWIDSAPRRIIKDSEVLSELSVVWELLPKLIGHDEFTDQFVKLYCAMRNPEWIVPFSYLVAGLIGEKDINRIARSMHGKMYDLPASGLLDRLTSKFSRARLPTDMIKFFSWADRAGDFEGALEALTNLSNLRNSREFSFLCDVRQRSKKAIISQQLRFS